MIQYKVLDISRSMYRNQTPLLQGVLIAFREHIKVYRCLKRKEKISCPNSRKKAQQEPDLNQLRKVRREKLADLQANGKRSVCDHKI